MKIILSFVIALSGLALTACGTTSASSNESSSSTADTYVQLGLGYLQEGQKDQARFNLLKAVETDPRSPDAHNAIALLYQSEGEIKLAEDHFKRALSSDADFNQARYNYARMLLGEGRPDDAEQEYLILVDDVNYRLRGQSFFGLGMARKEQENHEGAKEAFMRSYQRDPRLTTSLLELADIAILEEDYVSAKELLDRFEAGTEATPRSLKLGIDLAQRFSDGDAEASYSMSLRNRFPDSREAREHILATQSGE